MSTPAERNAEAAKRVRNKGISYLRTGVPIAWGYVLTFVADRIPAVSPLIEDPQVYGAVGAVVAFVWYAIMRWVEPRLPAWLTALVLGSNSVPLYVDPSALRPGYVAPVIPPQAERR
jgi:hypothetical protein